MTPLAKWLSASVPLILIGGCAYIIATSEPGEPSRIGDKSVARVCSQNAVKAQLKSPSTAKFPHVSLSSILEQEEGSFVISSYVDAQNSFGAMIRTRYVCEVKVSGQNCETACDLDA